MRVLHIWNTAGVASIIARYMDRMFGTQSWVIIKRRWDKFGFTTYGEVWNCDGRIVFALKALLKARSYDLIHVHGIDAFVPLLKFLYPRKPVVLHYHGTDIRGRAEERKSYYEKADAVCVSTPDLLETLPDAIYVPNPVDTELFYPRNIYEPNTAFHFAYRADDLAKKYAELYNLKLHIHNREANPIPYVKLPDVLSRYEYYIDVKRLPVATTKTKTIKAGLGLAFYGSKVIRLDGKVGTSLSKTGLEALACGLKVIRGDGKIAQGLPPEHRPENVAKQIWKIYDSLKR